jgi:hypothetical protein
MNSKLIRGIMVRRESDGSHLPLRYLAALVVRATKA